MDDQTPRASTPEPIAHWLDGYELRMRTHILFAVNYERHFGHGAPGHLDLITIATLARQLAFALDQELPQ